MRWYVCIIVLNVYISVLSAQTIYGLKSRSINTGGTGEYLTPVKLYRFEDDGTSFSAIAPVNKNAVEISADGLAYSSTQGLWCFELTSTSNSTLYQIDPSTAATISTGVVFEDKQIFGAAFDRHDRLWAMDETSDELLAIDIAAGKIVMHVPLTLDGDPFDLKDASGDICFNAQGKAFLVDDDVIYRLNVHTGILSEIYSDSTSNPKFLVGAVIPDNRPDTLITFDVTKTSTDNDDILVYDLTSPSAPFYMFKKILNDYNAGRGDLATAIPSDLIISNMFDDDTQGWTGAALSTTDLSVAVESLPIFYDSVGNYIGITDNDNFWTTFSAPAAYLGDKSDWFGGQISLDIQNLTSKTRVSGPLVLLVSQGVVLCSEWIMPSEVWQQYSVQLTPNGWHMQAPNGAEPSLELMYQVLSNLEAMYVIGDFVSGEETTHIGNFKMTSGLSADSNASGFVDLEDFALFALQWPRNDCTDTDWCNGQDLDKNGSVNLNDLAYLAVNWLQEID